VFLFAGALPALASSSEQRLAGKVSHLDARARTLAVMREDVGVTARETSFQLADDAKIMRGGKATSLEDLQVGQKVEVTYADEGSVHRAKWVYVMPAVSVPAGAMAPQQAGSEH
jgi:hypothetical protein